ISTFSATNSGAASTHTTIAPTILKAGVKDNVLPIDAQAVINFRILPGDSVQGVVNHVKATIKDPNITVESLSAFDSEPSAVSPPDADAFQQLHRAIKACYPDVLVSPYLVLGATDARYYRRLSENIYRFTPYQLDEEDLKRPHGTNERIRIATYHKMIQFYTTLLDSMAK
ncbi:MAG: M20/M25/M40 family metallo-hydrolase, partial [Bacteroidetes bacterium]|nr:M20/M25/M40 family metallo-hydrolase [Bacteroidota bacterium]